MKFNERTEKKMYKMKRQKGPDNLFSKKKQIRKKDTSSDNDILLSDKSSDDRTICKLNQMDLRN